MYKYVSTLSKKTANQSQSYPYSDKDLQCYDIKCTNVLHIRVSKCGLETRKSPSPSPTFGDKVGTGKGFSDSLEKIWGLGEVNFEEFLGTNPLKILKFEVGTRAMILGIIGESLFFPKIR